MERGIPMAKQIVFTYDGDEYTLEFTRRTMMEMENEGFDVTQVQSRPMTLLPKLFAGAFKAHHRKVKRAKIDEIFEHTSNKGELVEKLADLYNEPLLTLMEDAEDGEESGKNAEWAASW